MACDISLSMDLHKTEKLSYRTSTSDLYSHTEFEYSLPICSIVNRAATFLSILSIWHLIKKMLFSADTHQHAQKKKCWGIDQRFTMS